MITRRVLSLLLVVASILALAACDALPFVRLGAASPTPAPSPTTAPTAGPNESTVANPFTRTDGQNHVSLLMGLAASPPSSHVVGVGLGIAVFEVVSAAVKNAGGMDAYVSAGDTVLIVPWLQVGIAGANSISTDVRVVQSLVDLARRAGAAQVVVVASSIAGDSFRMAGYDALTDADLVDLNGFGEDECYLLKPDPSRTGQALYIPRIYMDADVVIGVPKLKTSWYSTVELGLMLGINVPSGCIYSDGTTWKNKLYDLGWVDSALDIDRLRRPDLLVIDGIVGGEGNGPYECTPVDSQVVFAGPDPVAVDTVALTFMGFTVDDVPLVGYAASVGFGTCNLATISVVGADLDEIRMDFQRAH
jgi:uncharacterized protein (DUF362 family)